MTQHSTVLILDYGSQYTQLIARRVRELGMFSVILPGDVTLERINSYHPRAIILSGGPNSVYAEGAPTLPQGFLDEQQNTKLPVLGICYGMQLLARDLGGKVTAGVVREYGRMAVIECDGDGKSGGSFQAWMSHGDEVKEVPPGFICTGKSAQGKIASMANTARKLFGLQFHPEVTHTENGIEVLRKFLVDEAQLASDWNMGQVLDEQVSKIAAMVGPDEHVICGLSGGVDSAVAAALVHRAIGDRLHCVFVDHGLLRYDEQARVMKMFSDKLHLPVTCVDASSVFLEKLSGVTDPEKKRKIIGAEFIEAFNGAAANTPGSSE